MEKQNEITAALVQQQQSRFVPPRDIPTFQGDPLQYRAYIRAFGQGVEEKASEADALYYLEQFTRGQPQPTHGSRAGIRCGKGSVVRTFWKPIQNCKCLYAKGLGRGQQ